MIIRSLVTAATVFGVFAAEPASAHPALVSSTPAAAASASNVKAVSLSFNETFLPQMSGLEIVMTGMPGMEMHHPAMKVTGVKVTPGADRKSLTAALARPLPAGSYDVNWHVVGTDTHRVSGKISFTVR